MDSYLPFARLLPDAHKVVELDTPGRHRLSRSKDHLAYRDVRCQLSRIIMSRRYNHGGCNNEGRQNESQF